MAKRPLARPGSAPARKQAPMTEEQMQQAGLNPFLKVDHINGDSDRFTLSGWVRRKMGAFGPQLVVEVVSETSGRTYDFGFGDGSPNHRKLFREMGRDETKWAGVITISKIKNPRGDGEMLHVSACEPEETPF